MKKNCVYLCFENNCIGWDIRTQTGRQVFGASIKYKKDGTRVLENFLWEIPLRNGQTLKETLVHIADRNAAEKDRKGNTRKRMCVEKIKIKPDAEARFQSIISKLKP